MDSVAAQIIYQYTVKQIICSAMKGSTFVFAGMWRGSFGAYITTEIFLQVDLAKEELNKSNETFSKAY
jgi:hypothetical protein